MLRFLVLPLTLIAVLLLQPPVDGITLQAAHCRDCKLTALSPSSSCKVQNSACFVDGFMLKFGSFLSKQLSKQKQTEVP